MKSSTGSHFIALDHVRALAAFLVFVWHFLHARPSVPVPFAYTPSIFPFALLDEGHTGVALFMTLSGYLFARLLDGKEIFYGAFLWNRALRLLPLLAIALTIRIIVQLIQGQSLISLFCLLAKGLVLPALPNGGWSLTVEFHFYLILPLLLWLLRQPRGLILWVVVAAIAVRACYFGMTGEVRNLAYWTMVGRIDQFVLGMFICQFRSAFTGRHLIVLSTLFAFTGFYWVFDFGGGFMRPGNPLWILLPTVEGLAYAIGIAWYETSFTHSTTGVSRFISRIGEYSYFIYLFHFFIVFRVSNMIHQHHLNLSNFYLTCLWAAVVFVGMMPFGYLSSRLIETPFLRLRKPYFRVSLSGDVVTIPQRVHA